MKICGINFQNFMFTHIQHQLEDVCGREWVKYTQPTHLSQLCLSLLCWVHIRLSPSALPTSLLLSCSLSGSHQQCLPVHSPDVSFSLSFSLPFLFCASLSHALFVILYVTKILTCVQLLVSSCVWITCGCCR